MAHTMNLSLRVCTGLLAFLALFFCPTHVLAQEEIREPKQRREGDPGSSNPSSRPVSLMPSALAQTPDSWPSRQGPNGLEPRGRLRPESSVCVDALAPFAFTGC